MANDVVHEFYHFVLPEKVQTFIDETRLKVHPESHVKDSTLRIFSSGKIHLTHEHAEAMSRILKAYATTPIELNIIGVSTQSGGSIFLDFAFSTCAHLKHYKGLRRCITDCYTMWKIHPDPVSNIFYNPSPKKQRLLLTVCSNHQQALEMYNQYECIFSHLVGAPISPEGVKLVRTDGTVVLQWMK